MNFYLFTKLHYLQYKFNRLEKQGLKFYQGKYAHGQACFTYREGLNAYLYEGEFFYEHRYQNFGKALTHIHGKYKNNQKEGLWRYENTEGTSKTILTITYTNGVREGIYLLRTGIKRPFSFHIQRTLRLTILDKRVIGPIQVTGSTYKIKANCDENGRPDGEWRMTVKDSFEYNHIEEWEHGVLKACYRTDVLTGKHREAEETIRQKIMQIVRSQAYGMESRVGSRQEAWSGWIHRNV